MFGAKKAPILVTFRTQNHGKNLPEISHDFSSIFRPFWYQKGSIKGAGLASLGRLFGAWSPFLPQMAPQGDPRSHFASFLERFGEVWRDRPYPAHRISGVTIDFLTGGPRVIPYLHLKKIIMAKAFRTRKWQQI